MARSAPPLLLGLAACLGPACAPARPPLTPAASTDVRARLGEVTGGAALTVLVFFSSRCPCQRAHDERLKDLARVYGPRGVRLVLVDSESSASVERDQREARARGYPFALVPDPGGLLADALGAEYATYSVIVDATGRVRYAGGIDSDKLFLTEGRRPYVRDALDDLLAGREPAVREGKTLGCALERR